MRLDAEQDFRTMAPQRKTKEIRFGLLCGRLSSYNLSGIAIDREQAKAALVTKDQIDIIPAM